MLKSFATVAARCLVCLLASASLAAAPWSPPAEPDVDQILKAARDLAREGRDLEQAAAMHRWYHDHALAHAVSHAGVRLSFALSDWHALAMRHLPALADMQAAHDRAALRVRNGGPNLREAMQDLAALGEQLADPRASADAMAWLDANRPADARRFAPQALTALVAAGRHDLALRYLDQEALIASIAGPFKAMTEGEQRVPEGERSAFRQGVTAYFDRRAAPAVAALVLGGRALEAQQLVDRVQAALGRDAPLPLCRDGLRGFAPPFRRG